MFGHIIFGMLCGIALTLAFFGCELDEMVADYFERWNK